MPGPELLLILAAQLVLTGLPVLASMLLAARAGVGGVPLLLAIGLAASGVAAMLAFWCYYADPLLGETLSFLLAFGSAGLIGWILWSGGVDRGVLRRLAMPLGLWALGSAFLVFLGFLHGGTDDSLAMSASRFSSALPNDNTLPWFFVGWFYENGHAGSVPPAGDWLSSDRPPLQIGYVLAQRPFFLGHEELHYQVLGVVLQQTWILGLWALLLAARTGSVTRGLVMATVLVSDVGILHGFFVWPKLLPAAMLLAAAALVLTPLWPRLRDDPRAGALLGALLGLALMAHGASIFGAIPLALLAALRGLPSWRWLGLGLVALAALVLPWTAYQKWEDPPGNRLTKWFLAGAQARDDRGTLEAIADGYAEVGLGGAIDGKAENLRAVAGGGPAFDHVEGAVEALGEGDTRDFVAELRSMSFFYLLPSLGLLLIAPFVMLALRRRGPRRPEDWRLALACLAAVAIGAAAWSLVLFGDDQSRTIVHQGSLLLPVLALCGCVAGLRAVAPRFALWWAGGSAVLTLALYVPALSPPEGTSYSAFAALLGAAGLAGFLALAFRGESPSEPASPSAKGNTLAG